jgi:DTW domain-containing protein YfiP
MRPDDSTHRDVCWRCRRPTRVCWCGDLRPVESQTHVVFVQHPRETRVPVSTCRMAHLSLPNSELHVGLTAVGNPRLEALCAQPGVAVLFPSEGATDVARLTEAPRTLVVVDGTWSNARKVVERCPLLSRLPRVSFTPERPGTYRIRKEPAEHCLSTIEAVTHVLERLEHAPGRFAPLLGAFDAMVERQLDFVGTGRRTRHRLARNRNSVRAEPLAPLFEAGARLVAVFGEANAWPPDHPGRPEGDDAELVQLVAVRLESRQAFATLLRPRRPLGPTVAFHLDLGEEAILAAPRREVALADFQTFLQDAEVLVGWGSFCRHLLEAEGALARPFLDLRSLHAQHLGARPGSVEALALALGAVLPEGQGRAARRLAALAAVCRSLLDAQLITRGAKAG